MKIQVINYGYENLPKRAHENDAGADVYSTEDVVIEAGKTAKIKLGLGIKLPDGYVAFVCPRSSLSSIGVTCELAPIDSTYTGEIHAIVTNHAQTECYISKGMRVGQLVVLPCAICDFVTSLGKERGTNGFGSTGK